MVKYSFLLFFFLCGTAFADTCDKIEQEANEYWDIANKAVRRATYFAGRYEHSLNNNDKVAGLELVEVAEQANRLHSQKAMEFRQCRESVRD